MFAQFPHVQASLNLCSTSPLKYSGRGMLTEVKSVHLNKLILLPQLRSQLLLLLVNGWTLPRQLLTAKEREKINIHIFLLKSQPTVQNEKKMKKKKVIQRIIYIQSHHTHNTHHTIRCQNTKLLTEIYKFVSAPI